MEIRPTATGDALALSEYYSSNKEHLASWEPIRESNYYTENYWNERLQSWDEEVRHGVSVHYVSVDTEKNRIVAVCSLTNIVRGPFQACNIGYSISSDMQGKGVMSTLVKYVLSVAFKDLKLNRVMANFLPRNERSAQLLKSIGFTEEGLAQKYLNINGVWEDHVLTSILNPKNV